jgi:hypothetical protein
MSEQTPAAQTPGAGEGGSQQQQQPLAQGGDGQQQQQTPPTNEFIMNQEQFNKRWGEKHGEIERELGMPIAEAKAFIAANKKPPASATVELKGAELEMAKMKALMLAKVPSEKIPGLISRVQGATAAEIEADIQIMIRDGYLTISNPQQEYNQQQQQQSPPKGAQGAGNPGVQAGAGQKIWTKAEVLDLQTNNAKEYEKHRAEIMMQMSKGLIK